MTDQDQPINYRHLVSGLGVRNSAPAETAYPQQFLIGTGATYNAAPIGSSNDTAHTNHSNQG